MRARASHNEPRVAKEWGFFKEGTLLTAGKIHRIFGVHVGTQPEEVRVEPKVSLFFVDEVMEKLNLPNEMRPVLRRVRTSLDPHPTIFVVWRDQPRASLEILLGDVHAYGQLLLLRDAPTIPHMDLCPRLRQCLMVGWMSGQREVHRDRVIVAGLVGSNNTVRAWANPYQLGKASYPPNQVRHEVSTAIYAVLEERRRMRAPSLLAVG